MSMPSSVEPHFDSAALLTIDVQTDTLDGGALGFTAGQRLTRDVVHDHAVH